MDSTKEESSRVRAKVSLLGNGVLLMRDGSRYEGEFKDGEINGTGERVYPDGTIYKGQFSQGEKHGYGEISYAKTGEWYKGEWHLNVRQGHGTLFTKDKNTFTVRVLGSNHFREISRTTGPTEWLLCCTTTGLTTMEKWSEESNTVRGN